MPYLTLTKRKLTDKFKESVHQEFERFMRNEMEDIEKDNYINSKRYKNMISEISKLLIEEILKKK